MTISEDIFCFPRKRLENSRLILEPFNLSRHADLFVQESKDHPELFAYVRQGPFSTTTDFEEWYNSRIASTDTEALFAILRKPLGPDEQEVLAGVIGLQSASIANATMEVGFVRLPTSQSSTYMHQLLIKKIQITILPDFQRSCVASNAVGLLLMYVLDLPPNGLGLRRCQWQSYAHNEASRRLATRLGFSFEGIQRFQRVVSANKIGDGYDTSYLSKVGGSQLGASRDSAVYAHHCDEWLEKRKGVVMVMERQ